MPRSELIFLLNCPNAIHSGATLLHNIQLGEIWSFRNNRFVDCILRTYAEYRFSIPALSLLECIYGVINRQAIDLMNDFNGMMFDLLLIYIHL